MPVSTPQALSITDHSRISACAVSGLALPGARAAHTCRGCEASRRQVDVADVGENGSSGVSLDHLDRALIHPHLERKHHSCYNSSNKEVLLLVGIYFE